MWAILRRVVKRLLRRYGYPPDKQEKATQTVLEQAELWGKEWAAEGSVWIAVVRTSKVGSREGWWVKLPIPYSSVGTCRRTRRPEERERC